MEQIVVGNSFVEEFCRTYPTHQSEREADALKKQYDRVVVEPRSDFGGRRADVVCFRRLRNLHEMTRDNFLNRVYVVSRLEAASRQFIPADKAAGLRTGRALFQYALLHGCPPPLLPVLVPGAVAEEPQVASDDVEGLRRRVARVHPDAGGSSNEFIKAHEAYVAARTKRENAAEISDLF